MGFVETYKEVIGLHNTPQDVERLLAEFRDCRQLLSALGSETRQYLLCVLLDGPCGGSRVIELAERTHLSRPSISHHMQILKEAGIVRSRKEGTCIYYYLEPQDREIEKMLRLFSHIRRITSYAPDRRGDDQL